VRQPAVYRRRPVQIEAMRFTRDNAELVAAWCGGLLEDDGTAIVLRLGTSIVRAGLGDWVARETVPPGMEPFGWFPIRGSTFDWAYEPVGGGSRRQSTT